MSYNSFIYTKDDAKAYHVASIVVQQQKEEKKRQKELEVVVKTRSKELLNYALLNNNDIFEFVKKAEEVRQAINATNYKRNPKAEHKIAESGIRLLANIILKGKELQNPKFNDKDQQEKQKAIYIAYEILKYVQEDLGSSSGLKLFNQNINGIINLSKFKELETAIQQYDNDEETKKELTNYKTTISLLLANPSVSQHYNDFYDPTDKEIAVLKAIAVAGFALTCASIYWTIFAKDGLIDFLSKGGRYIKTDYGKYITKVPDGVSINAFQFKDGFGGFLIFIGLAMIAMPLMRYSQALNVDKPIKSQSDVLKVITTAIATEEVFIKEKEKLLEIIKNGISDFDSIVNSSQNNNNSSKVPESKEEVTTAGSSTNLDSFPESSLIKYLTDHSNHLKRYTDKRKYIATGIDNFLISANIKEGNSKTAIKNVLHRLVHLHYMHKAKQNNQEADKGVRLPGML